MNASHGAPAALAFILAIPLFALPALGAPAHDARYQPAHHRAADFPAVADAHKTDGLSRENEDCSRGGCIDH
jgi:hypothetical protein